jgi:hypothetical protein
MTTYDLLESDSRLAKLVELAAKGKPFVKVVPVEETAAGEGQPIGFMKSEALIPDDFDRMGEDRILALFEGET